METVKIEAFLQYMRMMLAEVERQRKEHMEKLKDATLSQSEKQISMTLLPSLLAEAQVYDTLIVAFTMLLK